MLSDVQGTHTHTHTRRTWVAVIPYPPACLPAVVRIDAGPICCLPVGMGGYCMYEKRRREAY